MKALTLWQPWASLIAVGAKTIETRSWSTTYRGPLAIHAAATTKGFDTLPGDCEGTTEGGWRYGYIGQWQVGYCFRTSDEGHRGDTFAVRLEGETCEFSPPLGAIVATAYLVDVVEIAAGADGGLVVAKAWEEYHEQGHPIEAVDWWPGTDEEACGDFTPGRFGWLLTNVQALAEPIPARGRQGLWEWEPEQAVAEALTPEPAP